MSIVDSGTVITHLPPTAYSALASAFKAGMKRYPTNVGFDTCLDISGQSNISVLTVVLVLSGGAVDNLAFDGIIVTPHYVRQS